MDWLHFRDLTSTWTHLIWMLLAIPGTVLLVRRGRGDVPKQISLLIFGLGLIFCYGSSALFHGLRLPPEQLEPFILLDHIGIYVLIAASCTGMVFTLLRGPWRWGMLVGIWLTAAVGIAGRIFLDETPRWLNPAIYLLMGWGMAASYPRLVRAAGRRPVRLVWIGGLLYSIGAIFFITNWPVGWPGVLGAHELLHLFVMGGSVAHYVFVWKYVARYPRVVAAAPAAAELKPALA